MQKRILDFVVERNELVNNQYFTLKLYSEKPLPEIKAGQFVQVRADDCANVFLRRPFSVNFVDYQRNKLWLLVQIVGKATQKLSHLRRGDKLNLIFPLGNSFSILENKNANLLLAGGGAGVAPLLYLGSILKNNGFERINFLVGARTQNSLMQLDEIQKFGYVYLSTEDGSLGEKGFLTQHRILNQQKFDFIYACGPTPMLKAMAQYTTANETECEVSLENTMACGFGVCLCCATDTIDGKKCVCTEGPIFNVKKLKMD